MIQLQSILVPTEEVCSVAELYYHKTDMNRVDFDGYFNLFYIEKRKAYTDIENLFLEIDVQGYEELILVHDGKDLQRIPLDKDQLKHYRVEFPYDAFETGTFWFALAGEVGSEVHVKGGFTADMPENRVRKVKIGIDICTYKREVYVARNLTQLKKKVLEAGLQVSDHVRIFVIDNGKTLSDNEPVQNIVRESQNKIHVIPNMNAGGAGGFTRGMLEILDRKEEQGFTHVLLMDDDAVVEPDTLVRIYGFLSTVKEAWKDMTVGGAMLREDYPHMLFCAGEWWENGVIINPEKNLDLRKNEVAVCDYLMGIGHEYERYSGWWCCCYSLNVVREDNLPLPLFIHQDDIEFCLRNAKHGMIFLNGVGVWHRGWEVLFPGTNIYYDTRNQLIEIALHQSTGQKKTAWKYLFRALTVAAIQMKYKDAEMVCRGFLDYLRGSEWLHRQNPEKLHTEIRKMGYQMYTLTELKKEISAAECYQVEEQIRKYKNSFGEKELVASCIGKSKATKKHLLTYNGWLLPADRKGIKVIFSTDSPFETYRKKKIVLYEPGSGKVLLLEKKYTELFKIIVLYFKVFGRLIFSYDQSVRDYRENISKITNKKAWEEYLELR